MKFTTVFGLAALASTVSARWEIARGGDCSTCAANSCIYRVSDMRSDGKIDSQSSVGCYSGSVAIDRVLVNVPGPRCSIRFEGPGNSCRLNGKPAGWNPPIAAKKTTKYGTSQTVGGVWFSKGCRSGATIRSEINNFLCHATYNTFSSPWRIVHPFSCGGMTRCPYVYAENTTSLRTHGQNCHYFLLGGDRLGGLQLGQGFAAAADKFGKGLLVVVGPSLLDAPRRCFGPVRIPAVGRWELIQFVDRSLRCLRATGQTVLVEGCKWGRRSHPPIPHPSSSTFEGSLQLLWAHQAIRRLVFPG
ncbi:uncharacterized protein EV422DRAFT_509330 [Fimicolochytrium jonesii]|uniref:uncharacterized protein n=1 Tax=Fimicolochytrium jonesii TaxID=1396493 RepID=UPI0022FE227D|nr:uncharacterized protein EV422DRAFT_509330 [Fimicolochytrium jonesii]KAI8816902.1 hypothetical protein EV422DRAFT_509330 [Fimicolochytrium jonesii]